MKYLVLDAEYCHKSQKQCICANYYRKKKKVHQGIPVGGGMDTKKTFLNRCQQFSCNDQSIHITYLVFCL